MSLFFLYFLIMMFFIFSLILGVSSFSMFFIWVSFEINILMFLMLFKKFSHSMINSMMKYFIIQSLSSNFFLMSLIFFNFFYLFNDFMLLVMFFSMWMKIGFFPFSAWYFQVSENMNWLMWFFLNSFQKIMPLLIMSLNFLYLKLFNSMILLNFFFSMFEMLVQTSLRWMINCSSMSHFSWILISMKNNTFIWQIYLVIYIFSLYILYKILNYSSLNSFYNFLVLKNKFILLIMIIMMFNFMGLPPFIGFFSKVLVLLNSNMYVILGLLLFSNLFTSMIYFYFVMPFMINMMIFNLYDYKKNMFFFIMLFMVFFFFLVLIYDFI